MHLIEIPHCGLERFKGSIASSIRFLGFWNRAERSPMFARFACIAIDVPVHILVSRQTQ